MHGEFSPEDALLTNENTYSPVNQLQAPIPTVSSDDKGSVRRDAQRPSPRKQPGSPIAFPLPPQSRFDGRTAIVKI